MKIVKGVAVILGAAATFALMSMPAHAITTPAVKTAEIGQVKWHHHWYHHRWYHHRYYYHHWHRYGW